MQNKTEDNMCYTGKEHTEVIQKNNEFHLLNMVYCDRVKALNKHDLVH